MVKSMTGYGRGEAAGEGRQVIVEVKSVNHRFLEVSVRMPKQLLALEERIRKAIQQQISRGRVDVFISLKETGEKKRLVKVDKELGQAYYNALRELASTWGIPEKFELVPMSALPGLLNLEDEEEDLEVVWTVIDKALSSAVSNLIVMRTVEGEKLAKDLSNRKKVISDYVAQIGERSPQVVLEYRDKLLQRVQELLSDIEVDQTRLANEVAFFADRASIDEELVRLSSHLDQMDDILKSGEAAGRKLDFLGQEMNREINTIGSKANDLAIGRLVVDVKSELEKVREQVQNLE